MSRRRTSFAELQKRALEIRERYAQLAKANGRRRWKAADYVQGFTGDVGALAKLVMAKDGLRDGADVERKLAHELADCLWSVIVIADELGIALEPAFRRTMDELEAKIATDDSGPTGARARASKTSSRSVRR